MSTMQMDMWKYYAVTHRDHDLLNPMHLGKMGELLEVLKLEAGARVVDIACGKGELLALLHERYGTNGCGVDISPYFIGEARERMKRRTPGAEMVFIESAGADWSASNSALWDCSCCVGAEWVFGGYRQTLEALKQMTKAGGWIIAGAPHWRQPPPQEYLDAADIPADTFQLHQENALLGEELGLSLCYSLLTNQDDWDLYQGLMWQAVETYSRENQDDPDLAEIRSTVRRERDLYLGWERECVGWAIYAYRR